MDRRQAQGEGRGRVQGECRLVFLPLCEVTSLIDVPFLCSQMSLRDVNPLSPALAVLREPVNLLTVLASGMLFGAQYVISFTAAVTFAAAPYNYDSLKVGLVLVAFGGGNILGSILGGRYSDFMLAKLKKANGGVSEPEVRRFFLGRVSSAVLISSFPPGYRCGSSRCSLRFQ